MTEKVFDRETILDLTVNVIPLGLLAFFFIMFAVFNPFGSGTVLVTIQLGIIGLMFVGLGGITYYSGAVVAKAQAAAENDGGDHEGPENAVEDGVDEDDLDHDGADEVGADGADEVGADGADDVGADGADEVGAGADGTASGTAAAESTADA